MVSIVHSSIMTLFHHFGINLRKAIDDWPSVPTLFISFLEIKSEVGSEYFTFIINEHFMLPCRTCVS